MGSNNIKEMVLFRNNEYDLRGFCKLNQPTYNSRFMHRSYHYITARFAPLSSFIFWTKAVAMATSHPYAGSNFVIFDHFFLIFLISLSEMSLNFATLYQRYCLTF